MPIVNANLNDNPCDNVLFIEAFFSNNKFGGSGIRVLDDRTSQFSCCVSVIGQERTIIAALHMSVSAIDSVSFQKITILVLNAPRRSSHAGWVPCLVQSPVPPANSEQRNRICQHGDLAVRYDQAGQYCIGGRT